jgi:Protein of unknown function (DUF3631)
MSDCRTVELTGLAYKVDITLNGRSKPTVRVSRVDSARNDLPIIDDISPTAHEDRERLLKRVPESAQEEVRGLLDQGALAVLEERQRAATEAAARTPTRGPPEKQGKSLDFPETEPCASPVDGGALLDELAALFTRYCVLPPGAAAVLALWTLLTWVHDQAAIRVSPKLLVASATKRSGKTRVLEILSCVVHYPLPVSNVKASALFRVIEKWHPTLLIDEFDTRAKDDTELAGIINSGHSRTTAHVLRCEGDDHEPRLFGTWAPQAVGMIGNPPDTQRDRSIPIMMERKSPNEKVRRLRVDDLHRECADLRRRAARWSIDIAAQIAQSEDPQVPEVLDDRQQDNWRPLLMLAGASGEKWSQIARSAALVTSGQYAEDETPGVQCLADIRDLFNAKAVDRVTSAEIVAYLGTLEDRPWPEWRGRPITAGGLARLLKPFKLRPRTIRLSDNTTAKGYSRDGFERAFSRYLSNVETKTVTSDTSLQHKGLCDYDSVAGNLQVTSAESCKSRQDIDVPPVTAPAWDTEHHEIESIALDDDQYLGDERAGMASDCTRGTRTDRT